MKRQAKDLAAAAGGERTTRPVTFAEQRAFELQVVPHATHTSLIVDRTSRTDAKLWAMEALFPSVEPRRWRSICDLATYETLRPRRDSASPGRCWGCRADLLISCGVALLERCRAIRNESSHSESAVHPDACWLIVEASGVRARRRADSDAVVPLRFLHLYDGDYLASLLLLSGALLLALNWKYVRANLSVDTNQRAACGRRRSASLAFLAMGAWFNWQLADLWMNAPALAAICGAAAGRLGFSASPKKWCSGPSVAARALDCAFR